MQRTPLYQYHVSHGGKMVDFAGWEMPLLYTRASGESGIHAEHHQVRTVGGLFDVSHMGRVSVQGRHARRFLERLCTRRISDMEPGQCRYSLVCNDQGGVRDDILVYRMAEDDFLLVVNASNREKLLGHFEQVKGDMIVKIEDRTLKTAMIAVQGPRVMELMGKFSREIPTLKRYRFTEKNLLVMKVLVSRTGYTGEDGIEAILPAGMVEVAMKLVLKDAQPGTAENPILPCGLGARDTLRMEAGMPLYGHELNEDSPATAAGVDFAISLDKDTMERGEVFVGMEALKRLRDAGGPPRVLVGLALEGKRTARQGMAVVPKEGAAPVGTVTSGCQAPTLNQSIAMAYVDRAHSGLNTSLSVDTGRGTIPAVVVPMPFYKAPKKS